MIIPNIVQDDKLPDTVEEIIERTDPFMGEFSPSSIGTANCFRKFYYTKILKIKSRGTANALLFGIAFHKAMETYHALKPQDLPLAELQEATVRTFVEEWASYGIMGDKKRNLETGMLLLNRYCEVYQFDDAAYKEEDIETSQWMPMPNGTKLLVKLDRLLVNDKVIRLVDSKTTAMALTDYYFNQYENDLKMSLYWMVVENLMGSIDDMMIDCVKTPPPVRDPSSGFARRCFYRTELQLHDAMNTYCKVTDYIVAALERPEEEWADLFYCNQNECNKYGKCPFLPICKHGLDHPSISTEFDIGDRDEK